METSRDRVISVTLNEHEWQAFLQKHPQPVSWLRERIHESIAPAIAPAVSAPAATSTTSATTR